MRRVILNTETTDALGRNRQVLTSVEDSTRATDLREMRLYFGHPREIVAGHLGSGKPAGRSGLPGAVLRLEPTGLGPVGPRRCWQLRHVNVSCAIASMG